MTRFDYALASLFLALAAVALLVGADPAIGQGCILASLIIVRTRRAA